MIPATVPWAMMRPPSLPAQGPKSRMSSAQRIMSVVGAFTDDHAAQVAQVLQGGNQAVVARWCRPMLGSSRARHHAREAGCPIWLARRMRCASPAERLSALRDRLR